MPTVTRWPYRQMTFGDMNKITPVLAIIIKYEKDRTILLQHLEKNQQIQTQMRIITDLSEMQFILVNLWVV